MGQAFQWLQDNGWIDSRVPAPFRCDRFWYRRYPNVRPNCYGNANKDGIQVCLKGYDTSKYSPESIGWSFEVEITAEPDDGVWVNLEAYGIHERDIRDKLDSQVSKLIRAWEAVQTP